MTASGPWKPIPATLIVAAPVLLEALEGIIACVDRPGGSIRTISSDAIAKAKGVK